MRIFFFLQRLLQMISTLLWEARIRWIISYQLLDCHQMYVETLQLMLPVRYHWIFQLNSNRQWWPFWIIIQFITNCSHYQLERSWTKHRNLKSWYMGTVELLPCVLIHQRAVTHVHRVLWVLPSKNNSLLDVL